MFKQLLNRVAIDHAAKEQYGVKPSKRIEGGVTVYQASMTALTMLLTLTARKFGPIDDPRAYVIERTAARFSENVMYTQTDTQVTLELMGEVAGGLDYGAALEIETGLQEMLSALGKDLPATVRKEMAAHVALLLKMDPLQVSYEDRRAVIRDELGRLLGRVEAADVELVFNKAAGYTLSWPGSS
ncbi:MAG: hypothetical protein RIB45_16380 [Marivibrio sp.]|uniref:hypothetical protein n=1 Tax=Marivibrio sp. TaxID=2039719 RepID=UPI0032EC4F2B